MLTGIPTVSIKTVFPTLDFERIVAPDMSVAGSFFEDDPDHEDLDWAAARLHRFQQQHPDALLANGYLEQRAFYNTKAYEQIKNGVLEYRNIHLGTDFWIPAGNPVHAPFEGTVVISHNNDLHKDYGPTIVLKHQINDTTFFTLYGHLSVSSLEISTLKKNIRPGEKIGYIGDETENGHWVPHLHLQVITDLLGNTKNYNGVAFPSEIAVWKKRCPDPNVLFDESLPSAEKL